MVSLIKAGLPPSAPVLQAAKAAAGQHCVGLTLGWPNSQTILSFSTKCNQTFKSRSPLSRCPDIRGRYAYLADRARSLRTSPPGLPSKNEDADDGVGALERRFPMSKFLWICILIILLLALLASQPAY